MVKNTQIDSEALEAEASRYLVDLLEKLTGMALTKGQKSAVFKLACTLPDGAKLEDFIKASSSAAVASSGLPGSAAADLVSVAAALTKHFDETASYAALFKSQQYRTTAND